MNRSKRIVNSIFTDNPVRLGEEINSALLERAGQAIQSKRLQIVSEMFDDGEFSTKSLRETVQNNKRQIRENVITALAEAMSK